MSASIEARLVALETKADLLLNDRAALLQCAREAEGAMSAAADKRWTEACARLEVVMAGSPRMWLKRQARDLAAWLRQPNPGNAEPAVDVVRTEFYALIERIERAIDGGGR